MSVLSMTAPQFTSEDERLERLTYTEEELDAAHLDVYGQPRRPDTGGNGGGSTQYVDSEGSDVINSPDQDGYDDNDNGGSQFGTGGEGENDVPSLLRHFDEALAALEVEEKEAYLMAVDRIPNLVEDEAHPLVFLRAEGYNVWAAAERCVNYWELRAWLFGDRAWLPMTATGNGCLNGDDIRLLQTGFCTLLDEPDRHGRGIVCFRVCDRRLPFDRMAMVRVMFYILSVAQGRETVRRHGIVVVADMQRCTTSRFDRKFIKVASCLFLGYHPVSAKAYHMCAPPGNKSCFLLVLPYIRYFMTRYIRQRFLVHTGTAAELAMDLAEFGIVVPHSTATASATASSMVVVSSASNADHERQRQNYHHRRDHHHHQRQLPEILGGMSSGDFQEWLRIWLQRQQQIETERERRLFQSST